MLRQLSLTVVWLAVALAVQLGVTAAHAADLLIRNARLIDGNGALPCEAVSVLVRDGRIQEIGRGLSADGIPSIDAAGATVLPGLIDSHVHFIFAPGSGYRSDSRETVRQLNQQHLRAYLACGVTTVLDPQADLPPVVREIQEWLAAGNPGPRFLTTGPLVRPPGGYGLEEYGSVSTVDEVEAKLDLIQSLGGVGVKLAFQEGFKEFSPEIRDAIRSGAARRHLPLYVHATSEAGQRAALDLGAHAIMHAVEGGLWVGRFMSSDLSDDFVKRMVASGAYQLTTFSLIDNWPSHVPPERFDDPLIRLTVPEIELATARDPQAVHFFEQGVLGHYFASWLPSFARTLIARLIWQKHDIAEGLRYSQQNIRKLHEAGVPIVAASDAPSPWPDSSFHFHGPSTLREIELVGKAGLSPMDAIAAATRVPAQMLGLADEIGTVEVGKRADLVIVRDDPLADLRALRTILWTVKDGVARTPAEWMRR